MNGKGEKKRYLSIIEFISEPAQPDWLTYKSVVVGTQDALPLKEAEHMFAVVIQNHS